MKDTLVKAGIEAVRRETRQALEHTTVLEADLRNRKGWSEREQALFMQNDTNIAIGHLRTAIRALQSIRRDVREVLASTDPPALRKKLSALERGRAMHAEMEQSLHDKKEQD